MASDLFAFVEIPKGSRNKRSEAIRQRLEDEVDPIVGPDQAKMFVDILQFDAHIQRLGCRVRV